MSLMTDKQTINDLHLFGNGGNDGIYALFNRTHTKGGSELLEDMFRRPLSDEQAINSRSSVIRYFAEHEVRFPYESHWFDAAEHYLSDTDERTQLSRQEDNLARKFNQIIAADTAYKAIEKGVASLVGILQATRTFINETREQVAGIPYREEIAAMEKLLSNPRFTACAGGERETEVLLCHAFRIRPAAPLSGNGTHCAGCWTASISPTPSCPLPKQAGSGDTLFPKRVAREQQTVMLENFWHPSLEKPVKNSLEITLEGNVLFPDRRQHGG